MPVRLRILALAARALGIQFKIGGLPYGARYPYHWRAFTFGQSEHP